MRVRGINARSRTLGLISLLLAAPAWAASELPATLSIGTQGTPIIPAAERWYRPACPLTALSSLPGIAAGSTGTPGPLRSSNAIHADAPFI